MKNDIILCLIAICLISLFCVGNMYAKYVSQDDTHAVSFDMLAKYRVTLDPNEGELNPDDAIKVVEVGKTYGNLAVPKRTGYIFDGWIMSRLPYGYQEVEYLESDGSQWIDTGFSVTNSNIKKLKFEISETFNGNTNWQVDGMGGGIPYIHFGRQNGYLTYGNWSADIDAKVPVPTGQRITISVDYANSVLTHDGNTINFTPINPSGSGQKNFYLYKWNAGGVAHSDQKYWFKIWQDGELVMDFVPAVWKGEGDTVYSKKGVTHSGILAPDTAGFYDLVSDVFYVNAESGNFNVGNPVGGVGGFVTSKTAVNLAEDHTITAHWSEDPVYINFHGNGSSHPDYTQRLLRGLEDVLTSNAFSYPGMAFVGWSTEENGEIAFNNGDAVCITEDIDLYAQWSADTFTITLDPMGGTLSENTLELTFGTKFGNLPTPYRPGYTFLGWARNKYYNISEYQVVDYIAGTGSQYINTGYKIKNGTNFGYEIDLTPADGESTSCECGCGNTNAWSGQRWSGTYYVLGGSFGLNEGLRRQKDVREYFIADINGSNVSFSRTVGATKYQQTATQSGSCTNARPWLVFAYAFNSDGPSGIWAGKIHSHKVYDGDELVLDLIPAVWKGFGETTYSKNGVTTSGSLAVDTAGLYDRCNDVFYINSGSGSFSTGDPVKTFEIIDEDSVVDAESDPVLYAVWEGDKFTVTLDACDTDECPAVGNVPGSEIELVNDDTYSSLPDLMRNGFEFLGWFDEKVGGVQYNKTDIVHLTDDITLYAHWKGAPCTITLNPGEGSIDADGWTLSGDKYIKATALGTVEMLPEPTRDGYIFAGWKPVVTENKLTRLEYIKSSGSQWINSGYKLTSNKEKIEISFSQTEVVGTQSLFGAENGSYSGVPYGPSALMYIGNSTQLTSISGTLDSTGEICSYILETDGNGKFSVTYRNHTVNGSYGGELYKGLSIGILNNNNKGQYTSAKLYSFRITDNDVLVRDMIPCRNGEALGMFDVIGKQFYGNAGSGSFEAGSEGSDIVFGTLYDDGTAVSWMSDFELVAQWETAE